MTNAKTFTRPTNLNGAELIAELSDAGLNVDKIEDYCNGTIAIQCDDEELVGQIVAAHNGTTVAPEPTIEDKLASVGLSLPDLKAALGL
jgi:hypothetical protein